MNLLKKGFALFIAFVVVFQANAQVGRIKELKEEDKASLSLYFYPSTIRMLNIDKDPAFYDMVKDIKSLRVMTVDTSKMDKKEFRKIKAGIIEENYEELASMRAGKSNITLLAQYDGDNMLGMIALVTQDVSFMFLVMEGSIDPQKAMNMVQNGPNLKILDEFIGKDGEEKKNREEMKKRYENMDEDSTSSNQ